MARTMSPGFNAAAISADDSEYPDMTAWVPMNRIVIGIEQAPAGGRESSELHRFACVSWTVAIRASISRLYASPSAASAIRGTNAVKTSSQFTPITSRYGYQYSMMFQNRKR